MKFVSFYSHLICISQYLCNYGFWQAYELPMVTKRELFTEQYQAHCKLSELTYKIPYLRARLYKREE